jgi:hypothetical protein
MNTLFSVPLTSLEKCATGHHTWKPTLLTGLAMCVTCGIVGYCLSCSPGDIPPGSPLRPCRFHRYNPTRLLDSSRPLSALRRRYA